MVQVTTINIDEIKPYGKNHKKHPKSQIELLKKNIEELGFDVPIIIDKNKEIIAGHARFQAMKELGKTEVDIILRDDLSPEQVKARRIADNRIAELAVTDEETLKLEWQELSEGFQELTGWGETDFNWATEEKEIDEDEFDVAGHVRKVKTKIKLGDVFKLGEHRLMCGDSTKGEDTWKLLNAEKPILMVTDPPYGVNYDPNWRNEADRASGKDYPTRALGEVPNDHKIDWSDAYSLFPGEVAYVWHAARFTSEVADSLKRCDFDIISQIIWAKPHFILSRGDYHWKHEPCWYAVKKGKKHNWCGDRKQHTVWEIAGMNAMGGTKKKEDEATGHSTQKPVECMARAIRNNTKEKDGVYDPFGGSGSTLIACEQLKRNCFMMEIDPAYCQTIIDRWEKFTNQTAVKLE